MELNQIQESLSPSMQKLVDTSQKLYRDKLMAPISSANNANADQAWITTAPGRVNLIGEHTDYTQGFVFPLAIVLMYLSCCGPTDLRKQPEKKCFLVTGLVEASFCSWKIECNPRLKKPVTATIRD